MNELEIIRRQLATEEQHFAEVARACQAAIAGAAFEPGSGFARACAGYFAFAVARLDPDANRSLESQLHAAQAVDAGRWREFLMAFESQSRRHFSGLGERLRPGVPVSEWRRISRIDADSIVAERARYAEITAALPAGVSLAPGAGI